VALIPAVALVVIVALALIATAGFWIDAHADRHEGI
jgi:hypothetical protein